MSKPAITHADGKTRCPWPGEDPFYVAYHDTEWGVPEYDDRALYEKLILDGFQAGLSWITILRRRPTFRIAFHDFDIDRVAEMTPDEADELMQNAGIIRNRAKIEATISNARIARELVSEKEGAFDELMWSFAPPARSTRPKSFGEIPAVTEESAAMSKGLRKRGFRFVGPTTLYALMQSSGMVDDHIEGCWRA